MKVLFVSSSPLEYSSSANMRNIALLKGLIQLGHEVSIFTARSDESSRYHDRTLLKLNLNNRYFVENSVVHSQFTNTNVVSNPIKHKIKRYITRKVYKFYTAMSIYDPRKALASKVNATSIDETFDAIISSSDPKSSHLLAEKLLKLHPGISKKWIQYWGDPFTNDINKKSIVPNSIIKLEEKRILSKADAVIYVSPFTLEKQQSMFPSLNKKFYFFPIPYIESIIYSKNKNKDFSVGYFGDYNATDRDILPLYNAVNCNDVNLRVCGHSDVFLEERSNIKVSPRVNYETIKKYEQECNLLVCICNKRGTQIPGKIYHYASTDKPILVILDGENKERMRKYFESFNRYVLCDNTEKSIRQAINNIKIQKKDFVPSPYFAPDKIASQVVELIEGLD